MPADKDTLAKCEPILSMRKTIERDLNIQGQVSCPDLIDMRAIIPVYDFNPHTLNCKVYKDLIADLAGTVGMTWFMNNGLSPIFIRNIYCHLLFDIAARAALAAAGEIVHLTCYLAQNWVEVFRYGEWWAEVMVSVGNPGSLHLSTWSPWEQPFALVEMNCSKNLRHTSGEFIVPPNLQFMMTLGLVSNNMFPAVSNMDMNVMYCSADTVPTLAEMPGP